MSSPEGPASYIFHLPWHTPTLSAYDDRHFPISGGSPICYSLGTWAKHSGPSQQNNISVTMCCAMSKTGKTRSLAEGCCSPITPAMGFLSPSPSRMISTRTCGAMESQRTILVESSWIARSRRIRRVSYRKVCLHRMLVSLALKRSFRAPLFSPPFSFSD